MARSVKPRSLAAAFDSYLLSVVPPGASEAQVQETQRAFYAGAGTVLGVLLDVGDDSVSEEQGCDMVEALWQEAEAFAAKVKSGQA